MPYNFVVNENWGGIIKTANFALREIYNNEYYGIQAESEYGRGIYCFLTKERFQMEVRKEDVMEEIVTQNERLFIFGQFIRLMIIFNP